MLLQSCDWPSNITVNCNRQSQRLHYLSINNITITCLKIYITHIFFDKQDKFQKLEKNDGGLQYFV